MYVLLIEFHDLRKGVAVKGFLSVRHFMMGELLLNIIM